MYRGLVIADDLTGAADTGQRFAAAGHRTVVTSWPATGVAADVLVADTGSRTDPPDAAREVVAEVASTVAADVVYKKIDSTLRGNVAVEVEAALDQLGPGLALVAPAFPANGRVTVGGHQLVDGAPVGAGGAYRRERQPPSSDLVSLFAETTQPVAHVPVDTVVEGVEAVAERLAAVERDHGSAVVVCDALEQSHLATVAAAGERVDPALYVGSAGLAEYVGLPSDASNDVLAVVGSTNDRTVDQVAALPDDRVTVLDVEATLAAPQEAGETAAARAAETLAASGVAVVSSVDPASVDRAYRLGDDRGLSREGVEDRVGTALTTAARECWTDAAPDALFVTGGTVAKSVLRALGVESMELTGHTVEDGVPVARFETDDGRTAPLVTKAGGYGGRETVRHCLDRLRSL